MAEINWKSKYSELKAKYKSAVDTAFRLGCEQGMQMAQQQQVQEQQAQQDAQAQAEAAGQGQPGQEGQEGGAPGQPGQEQAPDSAHPAGSELDQHISQLEGMLGKSEITDVDLADLRKSFKALKFGIEMKKSDAAVRSIVRSLSPKLPAIKLPATMSKSATANLSDGAKSALDLQQKIVDNVMAGFADEETRLSKSIAEIVAGEGLKKD